MKNEYVKLLESVVGDLDLTSLQRFANPTNVNFVTQNGPKVKLMKSSVSLKIDDSTGEFIISNAENTIYCMWTKDDIEAIENNSENIVYIKFKNKSYIELSL